MVVISRLNSYESGKVVFALAKAGVMVAVISTGFLLIIGSFQLTHTLGHEPRQRSLQQDPCIIAINIASGWLIHQETVDA
ncbi:MAG: hypothetical protein JSW45_06465 [Thiotrichales bacterium]|nr:MAG: hypothetical protein JSW45_06465 [Thiotrichales bacterium]